MSKPMAKIAWTLPTQQIDDFVVHIRQNFCESRQIFLEPFALNV